MQPFLDEVLRRIKHPTILRFIDLKNAGPRLCLYAETPVVHYGFSYVPLKKCFQFDGDYFPIGITIKDHVQSLRDLEHMDILIQTNLNHFNYKIEKDSPLRIDKIELNFMRLDCGSEIILNEKSIPLDTYADIFLLKDFKLPF